MILPAYHAIFVSLATGAVMLAFLALSFRFWFRPRGRALSALWYASDGIALYGGLFGLLMLLIAFSTGLELRPMEALLSSPITKNKILMAILAIASWASFLIIRVNSGAGLWLQRGFFPHFAYMTALAAFAFLLSTNSVGGDIAGIPSGYEELAKVLGFRTRRALYFPTWLNLVLGLIGLGGLAWGIVHRRKRTAAP